MTSHRVCLVFEIVLFRNLLVTHIDDTFFSIGKAAFIL